MSDNLVLSKVIKQTNKDLNIIYCHLDSNSYVKDEHIYNTLLNYYDDIEEKYKYHKDFLENREKFLKKPLRNNFHYMLIPILLLIFSYIVSRFFLSIFSSVTIAVLAGSISYILIKIFKKPMLTENTTRIKEIEAQIIEELKLHMDNVEVI